MGITVCSSRSKPPQLKPIMKCVVALGLLAIAMASAEPYRGGYGGGYGGRGGYGGGYGGYRGIEKPKPNPLLKPMLMPMPTMDMVVMVDTEAMEDMVDTDTAVNEEVPMPKLMPTMDMEVVMVDMEVTA